MRYLLALCLLLPACASYEMTRSGRAIRTEGEYFETVDKYTVKEIRYQGLYNTLEVQATLLNTQVRDAQLDQFTRLYQWDDKKFLEQKSKYDEALNKETEIFLGFYTPEHKNDELNKPGTVWKLFLDVDGKRYEAKVMKIKTPYPELLSLYPDHNRFYTPYSVTFPVPMKSIETKMMKLTVTGPVSFATLTFNP